MPSLPPNQQRQSTEGKIKYTNGRNNLPQVSKDNPYIRLSETCARAVPTHAASCSVGVIIAVTPGGTCLALGSRWTCLTRRTRRTRCSRCPSRTYTPTEKISYRRGTARRAKSVQILSTAAEWNSGICKDLRWVSIIIPRVLQSLLCHLLTYPHKRRHSRWKLSQELKGK